MNAGVDIITCGNCGNRFESPGLSDFSYGSFILRTEINDETAYLDAIGDDVFKECSKIVGEHALVGQLNPSHAQFLDVPATMPASAELQSSIDAGKREDINRVFIGRFEGDVMHAAFSVTCDPSLRGEAFRIGLVPRCSACGIRKRAHKEHSGRRCELPIIHHTNWIKRPAAEKLALIDAEVRAYFAKFAPRLNPVLNNLTMEH